jgi:hypothetical protein
MALLNYTPVKYHFRVSKLAYSTFLKNTLTSHSQKLYQLPPCVMQIERNSRRARKIIGMGHRCPVTIIFCSHNDEVCQFHLARTMYSIPYQPSEAREMKAARAIFISEQALVACRSDIAAQPL